MTDTMSSAQRSRIMSRVRAKNTRPEMTVRRLLHSMGYRYRLHDTSLPGKPDLVFASRHKVIFVHGCFWHGHEGCRFFAVPKSNRDFWNDKFKRNMARDEANYVKLCEAGWSVLVIWQCELRDLKEVEQRAMEFLGPPRTDSSV
ncbi:very short patch repair endonuclease [Nitrosomonas halophila]|uniref:Very short patch repair endonuclease n=1 Tax=Nitrosomonas halophila TaxID=44576 RepID=A0A1H3JIV0_9PROT|nr:very short patch repair endonuclease [Nitrosomonas halophila]SDY39846.1 DNA mismatch endonuclease, patch repair protein [Nitrosomonas halophila]